MRFGSPGIQQTVPPFSAVHYSSNSDDWTTPADLFEALNDEFCFTLDPAATAANRKCEKFYTVEDNGLLQSWAGEVVFLNPPYGRDIRQWMQKALMESLFGAVVVCLVPARTDTRWWHDFAAKGQVRFIKGRLKFGTAKYNAPFASAIVVFGQ